MYREFRPSPSAARFIECYWALDGHAGPARRIVPDGRTELILHAGAPFQSFHEGSWATQPTILFAGQITGPLLIRATGAIQTIGVRFRPHGAETLLRRPVQVYTSRIVAIGDIDQHLEARLNAVLDCRSLDEQLHRVDEVMVGWSRDVCSDPLVGAAVVIMIGASGSVNIDAVASRCGLSRRQFERRFYATTGLSPKRFCRIQRFQRVFERLQEPGATWIRAAVDSGYYDQAHLIRDFREFAGATPTPLLEAQSDLAMEFLRSKKLSHFSKTAAAGDL